jgi:hypothetical protein
MNKQLRNHYIMQDIARQFLSACDRWEFIAGRMLDDVHPDVSDRFFAHWDRGERVQAMAIVEWIDDYDFDQLEAVS